MINKTFLLILLVAGFFYSAASQVPGSLGIKGDPADVSTPTQGAVALVGGGGVPASVFEWMIKKSGGGDVVVLTASASNVYNDLIYDIGGVNSVETLNITSRELADNDSVARVVRNAEMLFIGGGDQSRYMNNWRNTKLNDAINYLMNVKKVPVGGTSAGCAILTGFYFSGENGSAVSDTVLKNPFHARVTLYNNDFLHPPFLGNAVSDQHYTARKREGRHAVFIARIIHDYGIYPLGVAPDEKTAVCVNEDGMAIVIGEGAAYFIKPTGAPENLQREKPLQWKRKRKALRVYEVKGTLQGNGSVSVKDFNAPNADGGNWQRWWIDKGVLHKEADK